MYLLPRKLYVFKDSYVNILYNSFYFLYVYYKKFKKCFYVIDRLIVRTVR